MQNSESPLHIIIIIIIINHGLNACWVLIIYRVAQNKPDYSTFQPSLYANLHKNNAFTVYQHIDK